MKSYPGLRAYLSYIGTFKQSFWLTASLFGVADVIITLVPWLIGRLTDSLTIAGAAGGHNGHNNGLVFWTGALILASIGHDAVWRGAELLYMKLLVWRGHRWDDRVFEAVINHDYAYFTGKFTGKVSSYVNSLGRDFRELMDNICYEYVNMVVALPIITATMFSVNGYTGLIFVVGLALMFVAGRVLARIAARAEAVEADKRSTMDGYVVDAIANFVSVKAFGSERREAERLFGQRRELIRAAEASFFKDILFWGSMSLFVRWIIWPSAFILNVWLYSQGRLSLAGMTTFLTAIVLFSNFIWEIIWNISQLNIKLAGIEEAYGYLFGNRDIIKARPAASNPRRVGFDDELRLNNVSFAYPDQAGSPVLRDINLTIRRGQKIGIVGPSGGGKSTLLKLLLGYYRLPDGSFELDGQPVTAESLRGLMAYVPQDTSIFHRSIHDNIAYARTDASRQEVLTAARHAQADDFVNQLSEGYDTLVGERGIKLSGGQRQRIAIARAILKDAPLLLLDEATSALDSDSERLVQQALADLLHDRTALVIAHRLSTIQHMDRIIVMDDGRITEEGGHQELLQANGLYAKLWAHQSGGFIVD